MQYESTALVRQTTKSRLQGDLVGDVGAGAIAATLVTPAVVVIDRAIVEQASTGRSLVRSISTHARSMLRSPGRTVLSKPFGIVWTLYAATFCIANSAETVSKEISPSNVGAVVFASTFLVNVPLGVWKDVRFAQAYGSNSVSKAASKITKAGLNVPQAAPAVSRAAMATFLVRDGITIFGSFTLAPWLSSVIPDELVSHPHAQTCISQISVPVLSQIFATPLHLLGLDFYNRQYHQPITQRFAQIRGYLPSATLVRCIRIIPAFSLGCLANTEIRSAFHKQF